MTTPADTAAPTTPPSPPVLDLAERRVLGVLAEKQKTTPDAYPMTLNSLVTGCNQKSNRDPILNLTDEQVADALTRVQKMGLVMRLTGSRAEKWRHVLYEAWHVDRVEMAVLAELLLRSPQTEGELRTRVSRMEPIEDLEALRNLLRPLAERKLVVYLSPEGRRGTTLTHGFHAPDDLQRLRAAAPVEVAESAPAPRPAPAPPPPDELAALKTALAETQARVAALEATVNGLQGMLAALAEQLRQVREGLGL